MRSRASAGADFAEFAEENRVRTALPVLSATSEELFLDLEAVQKLV